MPWLAEPRRHTVVVVVCVSVCYSFTPLIFCTTAKNFDTCIMRYIYSLEFLLIRKVIGMGG